MTNIADGVDEIRKLVRRNVKYGADHIKMIATAGVLSEEESVGAPQFSLEEMKALVDEAAMWHRKVMAHAHGTEGIKRAIPAGVASIDHGSFIDDEGIRMLKEHGTFLVADIYNDDYILAEYGRLGYPESILEKERKVGRTQRENFKKAVQAGVKIAYGTDAGVYPHGWNAKQFRHMVRVGHDAHAGHPGGHRERGRAHRPRHRGRDRSRAARRPRGGGRRSPGGRDSARDDVPS